MPVFGKNTEEVYFKQLTKFGDSLVLQPLNPKYAEIEINKGERFHIVGKVVKKVKVY